MFLIFVAIPLLTPIEAKTTVTVSAPVNPVRTGDVISVQCHIRDIRKNHEVNFVRITANGDIESLALNKGILENVEDRVFLAVRDLSDGSSVYLLSIKDVIRADAGRYSCQVVYKQPGNVTEVAVETVEVEIFHFPADYPVCTPTGHFQVKAGEPLIMNCTTPIGFPAVDVSWIQGSTSVGKGYLRNTVALNEQRTVKNGMIHSQVSVVVSARDQGATFTCKITSFKFPEMTRQKCSVGPLIVEGDWMPSTIATLSNGADDKDMAIQTDSGSNHRTIQTGLQPKPSSKCTPWQCPNYRSYIFWILTTASASVFAGFCLLWDVILCVKVRRLRMAAMDNNPRRHQSYTHDERGDIYFEIPSNLAGDPSRTLYMTLEKPNSKGEEYGRGRTLTCDDI